MWWFSVLCACLALVAVGQGYGYEPRRSQCERITIPLCQDMPYNMTKMPNLMGNSAQSDAAIQVHEYYPLIEINCSSHLKFFLCSLYAPMCTDQVDIPIPSCRSICEEVKSKCLPYLAKFQFKWPKMLNCSRFPEPPGLCMEFPNITETSKKNSNQENLLDGKKSKYFEGGMPQSWKNNNAAATRPDIVRRPNQLFLPENDCPSTYAYIGDLQKHSTCTPKCHQDVQFVSGDKKLAEIWMSVWAALCFLSTLFTMCTFWIDTVRFKYPERPIIYLSLSYMIYSSAYLVRMFAGKSVISCDETDSGEEYVRLEGIDNMGCVAVFLLLYYFGMAGCIWWVILTLTWFLSAGRKWSSEALQGLATYFHLSAWLSPAILGMVALIFHTVDADELTGMCYIGNTNPTALLGLVIVPLSVFFVLGSVFIILGFTALLKIRKVMKHGGSNIDKLEKLMMRIGVFSVLYLVPALCVISCFAYEYSRKNKWRTHAFQLAEACKGLEGCGLKDSLPSTEVFMLKIFMSLIVGTTSGMWIWSSKTLHSWQKFLCMYVRRNKQTRKLPHENVTYQQPQQQHKHSHGTSTSGYGHRTAKYGSRSHHQVQPFLDIPSKV